MRRAPFTLGIAFAVVALMVSACGSTSDHTADKATQLSRQSPATTTAPFNACDTNNPDDQCPTGTPGQIAGNEEDCAIYQSWLKDCAENSNAVQCDDVTPGDPGYLPNPCGMGVSPQ
jgi:hypothetical protein